MEILKKFVYDDFIDKKYNKSFSSLINEAINDKNFEIIDYICDKQKSKHIYLLEQSLYTNNFNIAEYIMEKIYANKHNAKILLEYSLYLNNYEASEYFITKISKKKIAEIVNGFINDKEMNMMCNFNMYKPMFKYTHLKPKLVKLLIQYGLQIMGRYINNVIADNNRELAIFLVSEGGILETFSKKQLKSINKTTEFKELLKDLRHPTQL